MMLTGVKNFLLFSVLISISNGLTMHGEEGASSHPDRVENMFVSMTDITGKHLKPFGSENAPGTVLFFVTHDCPISNAYSPELARIRKEFGKKGFRLILAYVDPDVTREAVEQHMKDYGLEGFTATLDRKQMLAKQTGAKVTPEAVIILPDATIAYRGRIDDMYPALGKRRRIITQRELRDALNAILEKRPVKVARTKAIGCFIPDI